MRSDCPAGTYGNAEMLTSADCTGKCKAGYFCPKRSRSETAERCAIGVNSYEAAKYYCPEGTTTRKIVDEGHYTEPENESTYFRQSQRPCPNGYICKDVSNDERTLHVAAFP